MCRMPLILQNVSNSLLKHVLFSLSLSRPFVANVCPSFVIVALSVAECTMYASVNLQAPLYRPYVQHYQHALYAMTVLANPTGAANTTSAEGTSVGGPSTGSLLSPPAFAILRPGRKHI